MIPIYIDTTFNDSLARNAMSRTFLYARVSTDGQTTQNQLEEVRSAGYEIPASRVVEEVVSGSIAASERPGFRRLIDRLEHGDVLIVSKLDRLGRNAMDVRATVETLDKNGIKVCCLALGGADLTSAAGKMTMQVLNAVAEFERDLLIERTRAGLVRAKSQGTKLGRPAAKETTKSVQNLKSKNMTQTEVAKALGLGIATIKRHWNKAVVELHN